MVTYLTRNLADAQESAAYERRILADSQPVLYRLYTEYNPNLSMLVSRYFAGATIYTAQGLWQHASEVSAVIDILGNRTDLQAITHLAGDIKHRNEQSSVLVTWATVSRLDV